MIRPICCARILYGYLYRLRSSLKLEQETHRNIQKLWLLRKLGPDYKTIAVFRKDHLAALECVCRTGLDLRAIWSQNAVVEDTK